MTGVTAITSVGAHVEALMSNRTVKAWGWNGTGVLGDGTTTDQAFPVLVVDPSDPSGILKGVKTLETGPLHTVVAR